MSSREFERSVFFFRVDNHVQNTKLLYNDVSKLTHKNRIKHFEMSLPTPYISPEGDSDDDTSELPLGGETVDAKTNVKSSELPRGSYDIVVYGATGVVGKIATEYIFTHYNDQVNVVLSGRNESRLEQQQERYPFDIVECDSSKYDECVQLVSLLKSTGCLINLAGPYMTSGGANILKACVEANVSICDISGEIPFCRDNIAKHHYQAVKKGVRIVKFSGHDSLFFSMVVNKLAEKLKANGEELSKVELFDGISSKPSLGTIKTAFQLRKNKTAPKTSGDIDPLLLGGDTEYVLKNRNVSKLSASKRPNICSFLLPFFMAGVNFSCVKRDNAVLHYGKHVDYVEGQAFLSIYSVIVHYVYQIWTYFLIIARLYTNPTITEMKEMYLDVVGVGTGHKGTVVSAIFSVDGDPGYLHTATACVETALCIVLNRDKLNDHYGVISPAILNDKTNVLMDRLINCPLGCFEFRMKDSPPLGNNLNNSKTPLASRFQGDVLAYSKNYSEKLD